MKLKGLHYGYVAEIKFAVKNELEKVRKEELSSAFRICTSTQKPDYKPECLFLIKNRYVPSNDFDLKNQS